MRGSEADRALGLAAIADALRSTKRVILTSHVTPDGDGVGSAVALMRALRRRGQDVQFVNCSSSPLELRFLCRRGEFHVFDPKRHAPMLARADAIIATDLGGISRLSGMMDAVIGSPAKKILLDHHEIEQGFFDLAFIDRRASSTAEIVWRLLREEFRVDLDVDLAEPLYIGLVTDTGHFAYGQTSPRAHEMAADLLRAGVDPYRLWRQVHCQLAPEKLRFLGVLLARLETAHEGRVVHCDVTSALLAEHGVQARDAFEILSSMLRQRGAEVALFVMEIDGERCKVSLRSAGSVDVSAIAKRYGGGGHRAAAGCVVAAQGLPDARARLLAEIGTALRDASAAAAPDETGDSDV